MKTKNILYLKQIFAYIWRVFTCFGILTFFWGRKIPILCYHSVSEGENLELSPLSPLLFEQHLKFLANNYQVITLAELVDALNNNKKVAKHSVVLTFDDGYRDNYTEVFPLIKKYKVPITVFVATGFIENEVNFFPNTIWQPLQVDEMKVMTDSGYVTIGAHGYTHRTLTECEIGELYDEIDYARVKLEKVLNCRVDLFAYPNGQGKDISAESIKKIKACGFKGACSTFWNTRNKKKDLYYLNRIRVDGADTVSVLKQKLKGDFDYIYLLHRLKAFIYSKFLHVGIAK
ncbi:MAG: polysaccharide deacetylase family protein [Gammaproteobacteria bacterium]|jgi:peptidoglycan/xylan/chitin deacetylase (PgdA/CDA1 family)